MKRIKELFMNRYGIDNLNRALTILYMAFLLIALFSNNTFFLSLSLALAVYQLFRAFSKNFAARSKENQTFLKLLYPVKRKYYSIKKKLADKTHKYFRCPKCRTEIRVLKNKGKVRITCPKCDEQFIKNT